MIKFPLVTRKKYDIARNNLGIMRKAREELQTNYVKCQRTLKQSIVDNSRLGNLVEEQETQIEDLKKEIKRLKSICSKKGIDYKKKVK